MRKTLFENREDSGPDAQKEAQTSVVERWRKKRWLTPISAPGHVFDSKQ